MKKHLLLAVSLLSLTTLFAQNLQISGGNSFSAAVCDNQQVFVWGSNQSGQLGIDGTDAPYGVGYRNTPASVIRGNVDNNAGALTYGNLPAIRQIDAGSGAHILGLSCAEQVWAWGENDQGQLGRNATGDSPIPQRVLRGQQASLVDALNDPNGIFLHDIFYVSGGNNSSFALESGTGRVLAWGENANGQLGDGTTIDKLTPVYVLTGPGTQLTNIVQIEGGDACTYALDANGYIWSWGNNDGNKLGRTPAGGNQVYAARVIKGDPLNSGYSATPTPVQYLDNIVQISGGDTHCLALDANGNVWSFGGDWGEGQLGRGGGSVYQDDARRVVRPGLAAYATVEADFLGNGADGKAVYVSAGQASSAVVLANGRVVTFGSRGLFNAGATDLGSGGSIACPTPAGDMIVSGTLGDNATDCNSATCDGKATKFSRTPVYVLDNTGAILTGITQISDGDAWYYAISSTGTAYTWGWNRRGELGLGDYSDRCRAAAFALPSGCSFSDPCPGKPYLGPDVTTCPVFSTTLDPGVPQTYTSYKYTWEYSSNNGSTWTVLHTPTLSDLETYTPANSLGWYRISISDNRGTVPFLCAPCPVQRDTIAFIEITNPYVTTGCVDASAGMAQFEVVSPADSKIKWYTDPTGGTALNPAGDSSLVWTTAFANTNTSIPGCSRALFAEDVASFEATLGPTTTAGIPCAGSGAENGTRSPHLFNAYEDFTIKSVDILQPPSTNGGTINYTVRIYANNPAAGWNGSMNIGAPGAEIFASVTTAIPENNGNVETVRTLPVDFDAVAGNKYWLAVDGNNGVRYFSCAGTFPYVPTAPASSHADIERVARDGNPITPAPYGHAFNWVITGGTAYTCGRIMVCATGTCTLPVELINFSAERVGSVALLSWMTSSESNSSHYIILKSTDGVNYTQIGKVDAAGNSNSVLEYNFNDPNLDIGTTYYKLAQYDLDGKVGNSEVQTVFRDGVTGVQVVPNPNNGSFEVILQGFGEKSAKLVLLNSLGQEVYTSESKGNSNGINVQHLASGVYYLQVISEHGIIVEKVVKE